jgi:hypothetical protein
MTRSNILAKFAGAATFAVAASAAQAGSFAAGCTTAPQSSWMKIEDVAAKATADGYSIMKSKISGSCYEVYATKVGKRFELFYDPTNAQLTSSIIR